VNLALIRVRIRDGYSPHMRVPLWVPIAGFITSVGMIASALVLNWLS